MSESGPHRSELDELWGVIRRLEGRIRSLELERQEPSSTPETRTSSSPLPPTPQVLRTTSPAESGQRDRDSILRGIGAWIRACLEGQRRGLSGRELLDGSSHIYLVFRSIDGAVHDPVLIFNRWSQAAGRVTFSGSSRGGFHGDSVFIGLPRRRDAELVVASAGVSWPTGQ